MGNDKIEDFNFDELEDSFDEGGKASDANVKDGTIHQVTKDDDLDLGIDLDKKEESHEEPELESNRKLDEFKKYVGENPYLVLSCQDIRHFINMISFHSKTGYDIYAMSFKIDTSDSGDGLVTLTYSNRLILCQTKVTAEVQGDFKSCIVSVDAVLKLFRRSQKYLFLFADGSDVYGYVFGGRVFVETYTVANDICSKENVAKYLANETGSVGEMSPDFMDTFRVYDELSKLGTRPEERAIYFRDSEAYLYSGSVTGRFAGISLDMTLQNQDLHSVVLFFEDVKDIIRFIEHDSFLRVECGGRTLFMDKKKMDLEASMKHVDTAVKDGVSVDVGYVLQIISFLGEMAGNTGMINVEPKDYGFDIVCFQQNMENASRFPVNSDVSGKGLSGIRLDVGVLKSFLKVFSGDVTLKTEVNKLFVESGEERLMLYGNV